jgi:hypothetical protein
MLWLLVIVECLNFCNQVVCESFQGKFEVRNRIDAIKNMDMHMKVKQLNVNMQRQVTIILRPFLDLMYFFNPTKVHNMVIFMLDPRLKDLSLVVDYVGHFFTIKIAIVYDIEFFLPTLKTLYQKHHGQSNSSSIVVQKHVCNPNVVFRVGLSKEETCFEQISVISFTYLENTLNSFVLVCTLKLTCVTTYLSKFRFNKSCPYFWTFDVPLEEAKDPLLWWSKHEGVFSIAAKLAKMIIGILGSQIET